MVFSHMNGILRSDFFNASLIWKCLCCLSAMIRILVFELIHTWAVPLISCANVLQWNLLFTPYTLT